MEKLDDLIEEYYKKYVGLPTGNPIVRENQKNDAFELVVLETLYGNEFDLDLKKMSKADILSISKFIVPPPDSGIDIVVEHEDIDENRYDFIQVKNSSLSQLDIQQALSYMERTVKDYIKKPESVNENVRKVLAETNLIDSKKYKTNCKFILVHRGNDNFFKNQKDTEQVISGMELEIIRNSVDRVVPRVPSECFGSDSFNNFITYEESENEPAILMNICGYDLAELALKYTNTALGRNILFGQNLRESLAAKSKTYKGMEKTIREEPEKFWFYNNGITVIAEDYDAQRASDGDVDQIILKEFSIINGAQTTSALGEFLKQAKMDSNHQDIECLKKVFVLARVLKVTDAEFKSKIAIFNNTQNPITTRDMASNREEQLRLYNGYISGEAPNIYMEIRRGSKPPVDVHLYKHQYTTNEELVQLAYAGFMRDPYIAKDKKSAIFDTDYKQNDYLINEYYHKIFHYDGENSEGILFKKSKEDINELLFVHYLYKLSKKAYIKEQKERIEDCKKQLDTVSDADKKSSLESRIGNYELLKAICNICVFYCIAYYYGYKEEFYSLDDGKVFKYEKFYSDKDYQNKFIEAFRDQFLTGTIKAIKELTVNNPNLNTWIRDKKSASLFISKVDEELQMDMTCKKNYASFIEEFKN